MSVAEINRGQTLGGLSMTKRHSWFLKVALLVLMATLLTGCLWGSEKSSEKNILSLLNSVEVAMKDHNAKEFAKSFASPIKVENDEGKEIEYKQEDIEHLIGSLFAMMKFEGASITEFKFVLTDADIVVNKDSAVVEGAELKTGFTTDQGELDGEQLLPDLPLKRIGRRWKFDSLWFVELNFEFN